MSASWYTSHLSQSRARARAASQSKPPTVVLLTEDVANGQKAHAQGIITMSGEISDNHSLSVWQISIVVNQYVEQMGKDERVPQLLDLISAVSGEVEPTRASAAASGVKTALYPDVCLFYKQYTQISPCALSVLANVHTSCWRQSRGTPSRALQRQPVQLS